ncbi:hypothetical protein M413DRAFT_32623 [Hebeloma cylindrosporum]|uniref:Uncharacterized protein n=1 Tax=Hebeloma cylindrosporum TaxID=76867 RepID=A0A0C3BES0_HEBCY|nr:hypothetical protein M413DRAFT_32623 [Hebeloma cylindrosporum h7]
MAMHAIANSPPPSGSSSEATNEILAELIASLFLSRPSLNSSSSIAIDRVERSVPYPSRARSGFDISQLPAEIICEIFERFMEDDSVHPVFDDTPRPLVSYTCRSDPTKLGQICSRWRAVAVNLPKLWSNILIYNPKPSQVYLTNVWLERSGKNPLNLEVDYNSGKRQYDVRSEAQILRSFIRHLTRWKKFRFNVSVKVLGLFYALTDSPHKPLILESVDLDFHDLLPHRRAEEGVDGILKYFHSCPTLRQVVWHTRELDRFPQHAPSQLTHVHARFSVSIDDIMTFLPQIPLIQELQIESLRRPSKDTAGTVSLPLLLQHLRLLRILSHEVRGTSFIARLTCPSLESLEINHSNDFPESNQDLQEIPRFLHRSGCRLQKLDLRDAGRNITGAELEKCLSDSPLQSLTYLHIWISHISDQMVGLLSRKSPTGLHQFAPFLETLDLPSCETSDGLLANMVSSRWYEALDDNLSTPVGHLRKAVIFPGKYFGPIDEAFFSTKVLY